MSWPVVQISEVARVVGGATPKSKVAEYWDGEIDWATPKDLADLNGKEISSTPRKITASGLKSCAAEQLPAGSVLFSSRAPIGHIAINRVPMATNQGFKSFVPGPDLDASYLYWWLDANRRRLQSMGNGATFKEVSKAVVERISLPVPPLPEQQRIAAILDQADALRRLRRQALDELMRLPRAIFIEMFGDPTEADRRDLRPLGECMRLINGRAYRKHEERSEGTPVLRIQNLNGGDRWFYSDLTLPEDKYCEKGDLLFAWSATFGPYIWWGPKVIYHYHIWKIQPFSEVCVKAYAFQLLDILAQSVKDGGRGITMTHATKGGMEERLIPMPDYPQQKVFEARFDAIMRAVDVAKAAIGQADALFTSLQHRAFRGEL